MAIDPTAILGPDSSQYTPDVLARRQAIAQKLYFDAAKTRPYRTWLEGVGDLANTGVYAAAMKQGNDLESGGQKAIAQALLGGGSPQVGPPAGGIGPQAAMPQVPNGAPDSFAGNIDQGGQASASPDLASRVKKFEGYNPKAYSDYKQYSIGYGTKANSPNEVIDQPEAERRLGTELGKSQALVNQFAPNAPPGVKDALSSLTYNAGPGWMQGGLGKAVQAGDWDRAKAGLLQYNRAGGEVNPGLVARRQQESQWFNQTPPQPNSPGGGLPGGDPQLAAGPQAPVQVASLGNDMPVPGAPPVPGRDTLTPQDQSIAPPGANNPAIAAALGQQGATGAVPPPQPDRAAIAGALNPQAPVPPQNVPQPPVQMAQAQGLPPQAQPQGAPQGQQLPPQVVQMLQHPNPYVRQRGIELATKLQEQQLAPPEFKTLDNGFGQQTPYWVNKGTQTMTPAQIPGVTGTATDPNNPPATGEDFIKTLPSNNQQLVRDVAAYKVDPAKLGFKERTAVLRAASQFDPTFDQSTYGSRAAAIKEFNSGGRNSPAGTITTGNTAIGHAGDLFDLSKKVGGVNNAGYANLPANAAHNLSLKLEQNPDAASYNALLSKFVEEGTTFYRNTGGTEADLKRDLDNLSLSNSPASREAALKTLVHAFNSKIDAFQSRYHTAMGDTGWKRAIGEAGPDFPIVQQKSQDVLKKINGDNQGSGATSPQGAAPAITEGATATNPQTGQKLMFKNGQWGPAQ